MSQQLFFIYSLYKLDDTIFLYLRIVFLFIMNMHTSVSTCTSVSSALSKIALLMAVDQTLVSRITWPRARPLARLRCCCFIYPHAHYPAGDILPHSQQVGSEMCCVAPKSAGVRSLN